MSNLENFIRIKDNLLRKDQELTKLDKNLNENFQLDLDKHTFIDRIENNIKEMYELCYLLQFKYDDLKFYYDFFNIFIIIVSAILTILEAVKNEFDYENESESIKYFFKLGPIFLSTIITLVGTIIKFKKYQPSLEDLTKSLEKAILTAFRMKKLQEQLHFANGIKLDTITEMYLDEIFILYNQSVAEMTKCISFSEKINYKQKFNKYKRKEKICKDVELKSCSNNNVMDLFKDRLENNLSEKENDLSMSRLFSPKPPVQNKRFNSRSSEMIVNLQMDMDNQQQSTHVSNSDHSNNLKIQFSEPESQPSLIKTTQF